MFDLLYRADEISDGINVNKSMTIWQSEDILAVVLNEAVEIYIQTTDVVETVHSMKRLSTTRIFDLWDNFSHLVVDVIFRCDEYVFRYVYGEFITRTGKYPLGLFGKYPVTMELFTGMDPVWLGVNVIIIRKVATVLRRMESPDDTQ
jgi:hypothetical protein